MPNINVTVYDSTENKRVPVELPDDAPCNKIVAVLVQEVAAADERSGWSAIELQIPSQEFRATDSGCPDPRGSTGARRRHSAPATRDHCRFENF